MCAVEHVLRKNARVAELAYAYDSKSYDRKVVWVRLPPRAQIKNLPLFEGWEIF